MTTLIRLTAYAILHAKDHNKLEYKRSALQMAELGLRDGKMNCDRDK